MASSLYWTSGLRYRNFGDAWLEVVAREVSKESIEDSFGYDVLIGGGSILSDYWLGRLADDLIAGGTHVLGRALMIGPGLPRAEALADKARYLGDGGVVDVMWVRGPLTSEALSGLGLRFDPIGDPVEMWSLIRPRPPESPAGVRRDLLVIPHALIALDWINNHRRHPCFTSPWVEELDVAPLIRQIASSDFVATGSLHVAICAYMHGVPFAFIRNLFPATELLFKYEDWCASAGIPFMVAESIDEGREWSSSGPVPVWTPDRAWEMMRRIRNFSARAESR